MICSALWGNSKSLPGTEVGVTQREIDKSFANITSGTDGDSGTSRRVFGSLITWMQEKTALVFVAMTCNNVEVLPAELLRKGRLDELFFLSLPTRSEREEIWGVHLAKVRLDRFLACEFDLELLAARSDKFSGAEIEQCVYEAMQIGFSQDREFTQADLLNAIAGCVPIAQISQPQIERLKAWASISGARPASISDTYKPHQILALEVDADEN